MSYVSLGQYTFSFKGWKNVPIKGVDDRQKITATSAVSSTGRFLPIQLIYNVASHSLPKYDFPVSFSVEFTKNHWSNTDKSIKFFDDENHISLSTRKALQKALPQQQHSLVIMDTFKGQDNDILKKFCSKNRQEIVIVPRNLTDKIQPLDLPVNKAAKAFI